MAAEEAHHLLPLPCPQQPGVDKDAGQLVADRLVQQRRDHRGIDPAGKAADDPCPADLMADPVDRLGAEGRHRPVAAAAGDLVREIAQQLAALRGVHDLGMKENAVEPSLVIGDRGIGGGFARGNRAEARWQCVDPVAVAHPHLLAPPPWAVGGHSPSNSAHSSRMSIKARPNSWCSLNVTRPPSWAHIVCMP